MDQTALVDTIVKTPEYMTAAIAAVGAIFGALLATVVTVLSVSMTNRHSRKQQEQQLDFESTERQRDRIASLRRDVYLPAADAFTGLISGMSQLMKIEASDGDLHGVAQAFGAALTRIQMIASPETIRRVADLQREFVSTISILNQKRFPMIVRQQQIDVAADVLKNYEASLDALEDRLTELTRVPRPPGNENLRIATVMLQNTRRLRDEARIDWLRLRLAQETARADIVREFVRRTEALMTIQAPLLSAIRGELENDAALQLITEESEKTNVVGVRSVSDLIPIIDRTIGEMQTDLRSYEERKLAEAEKENQG